MDEAAIRKLLTTKFLGRNLVILDRTDSTNSQAKLIAAKDPPEGTVVIAEEQTEGRGRLGRKWQSPHGLNLMFSVLLKPPLPPDQMGVLSLYAGLSAAKAIGTYSPAIRPTCKWPNDVLLAGKKVCGILSETIFRNDRLEWVILGIGINVNQKDFPSEIRTTATSLALAIGHSVDRHALLASVLGELEQRYRYLQLGSVSTIISEWKRASAMLGNRIQVLQNEVPISGIARDIADDGALILQSGNRELRLLAGDVTILEQ